MTAISIKELSYAYGKKQVLKNIHLDIPQSKKFGILGPNGSGKSTLLHILSGLYAMQSGEVDILGHSPKTNMDAIRKKIGVTFQHPSLDKKLTVRENLYYYGMLYGFKGLELSSRIDEVCEQLDLREYKMELVEHLSGGFKRRTELAKILLTKPKLLLLDEPTTALDPGARIQLWKNLDQLKEQGVTLIFTTHLMEEAELCDELALFHQGKLVSSGTPLDLKKSFKGQMLVVTSKNVDVVMSQLQKSWQGSVKMTNKDIRIEHPDAATLAGNLLSSCGHLIDEITLRYPTLEDVFLSQTGSSLKGEHV